MAWVLDGMFSHGAPLTINKMLITREWGSRDYYLVEMCLDNNPYTYERVSEKLKQKFEFEKLHLYEWRNPGDADYESVIKPKDLLLLKPWISSLRPYTNQHKAPIMGVAFDKTAQNKKAIEVLKGRGYESAGYGGNFGL